MRLLWVTNDLPPRTGGIQQFVDNLIRRVHPADALVLGPAQVGAEQHDRDAPYPVVRHDRGIWPTPRVLRAIRENAVAHRPEAIVLGASWPLGELAPHLRSEPGVPVVALSHGLEAGLATVGLGVLLRRATRDLAAVTTISDWSEGRLGPHLRADRVERVPPGVDADRFHPARDGSVLRERWGMPEDALVVGCVSRLVRRKGQDRLLDAWPAVSEAVEGAWLVLVGGGPLESRLRRRASGLRRVVVAGEVDWTDLAASYAALDVFAMPCRTRLAGLDVEGLGIVYLEAQACGVPAVAGASGGAPEAVRPDLTGFVVDGRETDEVAAALIRLLGSPELRSSMGTAGRAWIEERWSWKVIAERFEALLRDVIASG